MSKPMMKCGHAPQGETESGAPVCVICYPSPLSLNVEKDSEDLEGRTARCSYYGAHSKHIITGHTCDQYPNNHENCRCERPSSPDLALFRYRPERDHDEFYCGCMGWH